MENKTITRIWHGATKAEDSEIYLQYLKAEDSEIYLQYLEETGIKDYKKTEGNLGVQIWRRIEDDKRHFWAVTRWNSFESIKKFVGEDYEKARYYQEDEKYLLEFEPNVIHCETFEF